MLVVKNGVLVTPSGQKRMDLAIADGKIAAMEESIAAAETDEVVDAALCYVYPAFVRITPEQLDEKTRAIPLKRLYQSEGIHRDLLLYSVITGETEVVMAEAGNETEWRLLPGILMHIIGDSLDPFGYMKLLSENPARVRGLLPKKGSLTIGADADLVIWDPNVKRTVLRNEIADEMRCQAYLGATAVGNVRCRITGGQLETKEA